MVGTLVLPLQLGALPHVLPQGAVAGSLPVGSVPVFSLAPAPGTETDGEDLTQSMFAKLN